MTDCPLLSVPVSAAPGFPMKPTFFLGAALSFFRSATRHPRPRTGSLLGPRLNGQTRPTSACRVGIPLLNLLAGRSSACCTGTSTNAAVIHAGNSPFGPVSLAEELPIPKSLVQPTWYFSTAVCCQPCIFLSFRPSCTLLPLCGPVIWVCFPPSGEHTHHSWQSLELPELPLLSR